LRSNTRNRVLGGKGGTGKMGGTIALPSSLLGEARRGAATLCSDPCGDERHKAGEDYVMLCPLKVNTIFSVKNTRTTMHRRPYKSKRGQQDKIYI
jgi:hypothetical protein